MKQGANHMTTPNKLPPIIGLTGAAGSGKDTVRAMLEDLYGYTGIAFADPMRVMVRALFEFTHIPAAYATNRDLKETAIPGLGTSYRHIMQTMGTEWGRVTIPGIWIRLARARLQDMADDTFGPLNIVISDVRFADEAAWVKANGGTIWRVVRPSAEPVRAHISEAGADTIAPDACIHNTGTLDDLRAVITAQLAPEQRP